MTTSGLGGERSWEFWIDRGGTFTDVVARDPEGHLHSHKLLSENPGRYEDPAVEGILALLAGAKETARIRAIKMGTTVATNALLERKGVPTALVITRGFGDALRIGYQNRPHLFKRHIVLPSMLYSAVIEAGERVDAGGRVLEPLDEAPLKNKLVDIYEQGTRSIAIVFMHGYRFPDHENRAAQLAREIGYTQISVSHEVIPLMKLVSRGDTTVVDAYLSPLLHRYVRELRTRLASRFGDPLLMFMQSNGGLIDAERFRGKNSILSGPAGGVVGLAMTGEMAGFKKLIGFDMGGTSTDVSLYDGAFEHTLDSVVAGVRLRAPMMKIHTVAAGGGSLLHFDGGRFRVGPDSAGSNPGPACYRRDGPLTVTDVNVMLGRVRPEFFPAVFGPRGDQTLDTQAVRSKFEALRSEVRQSASREYTAEEIAEGFLRVAVENMANAIKRISVQQGLDPREYVLGCFGGAGGQHACLVADILGIEKILIHPLAGVLSAYGMGLADLRATRQRSLEVALVDISKSSLERVLSGLERDCRAEIRSQGIGEDRIEVHRSVQIRYAGTDTSLTVPATDRDTMARHFSALHRRRFGFVMHDKPLTIESAEVAAVGKTGRDAWPMLSRLEAAGPAPTATEPVRMRGEWTQTGIYRRSELPAGSAIVGPAVIVESQGTTVVDPDWCAAVTERGDLIMSRTQAAAPAEAIGTDANPIMLEVFNNLFMHIAEQMGVILENTAHSVNIKERLDFSCALFDSGGALIANAPHMPVHLGSMGDSVQTVLHQNRSTMHPGDVYLLNTPYNGGTHLPDVTVVTPVFDDSGTLLFVVASRAHHADIGGMTPGSMPPDSHNIHQEGVLFDNFKIVERGVFLEDALLAKLREDELPARNPLQNVADVKAQIAANKTGVEEVRKMIEHFSLEVVQAYMSHVQNNAEESVRRVLAVLKDGEYCYEMDQGQEIRVKITMKTSTRSARVDFTGTSPQDPHNFNAPVSVCRAAVLYVFRTLVDDDIPLNAGCLKPIELVVPEGCMLNPRYPAAVVAGNVETSQCITDALYGALGIQAAAQGTMNNFTFGDAEYQYYETICGGSGAGDGFDGTSAVQTHMTNSRLTDPEVLEWRFPVRVREFSVRRGSGGNGRYRGGDGTVRKIEFLKPLTASILSNHRKIAPFGMAGGQAGLPGRNRVERRDGEAEELGATASVEVYPGDVFVIETPGGGGFGAAPDRSSVKTQ